MWDKNKNLENQLLCLNFKNYEIAKLWTLIMTEIEINKQLSVLNSEWPQL